MSNLCIYGGTPSDIVSERERERQRQRERERESDRETERERGKELNGITHVVLYTHLGESPWRRYVHSATHYSQTTPCIILARLYRAWLGGMGVSFQFHHHHSRGCGMAPNLCKLWSSPTEPCGHSDGHSLCLAIERCPLWGRLQAWAFLGWRKWKETPMSPSTDLSQRIFLCKLFPGHNTSAYP